MSEIVYRVNIVDKQREMAKIVAQLDKDMSSVKSRMDAINSKIAALKTQDPTPIADLHEGSHPIRNLSRELDFSPKKGLVQKVGSRISQELEKQIQSIAINPAMIHREENLTTEEKRALAEVRRVTIDKIERLLKGLSVEDVKLEGFKFIRQDGNLYILETEVPIEDSKDTVKVQSKVTIMPDGSLVIHQIDDHPKAICDMVGKRIAGTIDVALDKTYVKEFMLQKNNRHITGVAYVAGKRVVLEEEMCG